MVRSEGLALSPFGVLGSGKIHTNAWEARHRESGDKGRTISSSYWERTPEQKDVRRARGDREGIEHSSKLVNLIS